MIIRQLNFAVAVDMQKTPQFQGDAVYVSGDTVPENGL